MQPIRWALTSLYLSQMLLHIYYICMCTGYTSIYGTVPLRYGVPECKIARVYSKRLPGYITMSSTTSSVYD